MIAYRAHIKEIQKEIDQLKAPPAASLWRAAAAPLAGLLL